MRILGSEDAAAEIRRTRELLAKQFTPDDTVRLDMSVIVYVQEDGDEAQGD